MPKHVTETTGASIEAVYNFTIGKAEFDAGAELTVDAGTTTNVIRTTDTSPWPLGHKNAIINGAFFVNQRAYVSGTGTAGANAYTLDRWRVVTAGQSVSFVDADGTRTVTAPAGGMEQIIEGTWLQSGTYTISWTGTATCTVGGTARTSGASFAVTGGANLTIRFTGGTVSNAQLERGSVATPFEQRPYAMELALCKRYYERINAGAVATAYLSGFSRANTTGLFSFMFTEKRTAPTISFSGHGAFLVLYGAAGAVATTNMLAANIGPTQTQINATTAAVQTVGEGILLRDGGAGTSWIGIDAEL